MSVDRYNSMSEDDESRSGIFTTDGQSTLGGMLRSQVMMESDRVAQEFEDVPLNDDYESLTSGIDDSHSYIMSEPDFRSKVQREENIVLSEYSLDDSTLDLGDYTNISYRPEIKQEKGNVNASTLAIGRSSDRFVDADLSSIFDGAYSRVMRSFLFPSLAPRRNADKEQRNISTKNTAETLSPVESQHKNPFDEESNEGRPTFVDLNGKTHRTPGTRGPTQPKTAQVAYQQSKFCGIPLSRVVLIVLFILLAAVVVAVVAAVAMANDDGDSTSSTGPLQNVPAPSRSPISVSSAQPVAGSATLSPVTTEPTVAPAVFTTTIPVKSPTQNPSTAPTKLVTPTTLTPTTPIPTQSPIIGTREPTLPPPTGLPTQIPSMVPTVTPNLGPPRAPTSGPSSESSDTLTELPTLPPTEFPVELCGSDDDGTEFFISDSIRTCEWFRGTSQAFIDISCNPDQDVFWVCRETCQNCLESPTISPVTQAPTQRPQAPVPSIESIVLEMAPASTVAALERAASPQRRAVNWMTANEENIIFFPNWRLGQLFAVATFAFATNLAGQRIWLSTLNECQYPGIECDSSGRITQLSVGGFGQGGQLPPEISMFSSLILFDGRLNRYQGPIPDAFGQLPSLTSLRLEQNNLTGNVPSSFVDLAGSLSTLRVDRNSLSGDFPNDVLSQLTSLRFFTSYSNQLVGNITETVCDLGLDLLVTDCANMGCYTSCVD